MLAAAEQWALLCSTPSTFTARPCSFTVTSTAQESGQSWEQTV
jgi:hypothetical protein